MKYNVAEVLYWIQVRRARGSVNGVNSFILQELLGIAMHQEEPRTH